MSCDPGRSSPKPPIVCLARPLEYSSRMRTHSYRARLLLGALLSLSALALPLALSACTSEEVVSDHDLSVTSDGPKPADLAQLQVDGGQGD